MSSSFLRRPAAVVVIASLIASAGWSAETTSATSKAPASSSKSSTPARGKGLLPDPSLLDGSTQPAEKKNEQGMIGDFELPGDENVRNGKVGGGQQGGQPGGKQGGQNQQNPGLQIDLPVPSIPNPLGGAQSAGGQAGGGGLPQLPQMGKQGGMGAGGQQMGLPQLPELGGQQGGQAGGASSGDASSKQGGGSGDPNAKAEGVQVGQLGGEGASQNSIPAGDKPGPVAIGDSAMKISTPGVGSGVVGGQQIAIGTQQSEKNTGTGGKGTGGASSGPNRTEKGRTMPAGL